MRSAILCVMVLAAGCVASQAPEPTPTPPAEASIPTFLDPVVIGPVNDQQAEFPMAVSPDGKTILTCTHGGFAGPAPKYASTDGGATWTPLTPSPPTGVAGDCWAQLGTDGTWYFIDSQVGTNTVSSTKDEGATWVVNRVSTPPVGGTADRPYMVSLADGRMGLTYVQDYLVPGFVAFTRSDDAGATWTEPVRIHEADTGRQNVMHGIPQTSSDGERLLVPLMRFAVQDWPTMSPADSELLVVTSVDEGATWREQPILSASTAFTPPAFARAGTTFYWVYQVPNGTGHDLVAMTSIDDGKTWNDPVILAGPFQNPGYMWLSGSPDGSAVLSLDTDPSPIDPSKSGEHLVLLGLDARTPEVLAWASAVAPATNAEFSTVAHDGDGRLFASYRHDGDWLFLREST